MNISELLLSFKHKEKIQIRFKDIDKLGHVNNAVHLTYFEIARSDYFKQVIGKNNWTKAGIILASTTITYKQPIVLEDDLLCYTKISKIGGRSFEIEHLLVIQKNTELILAAQGTSIMVCFDYSLNKSISVPAEWVNAIQLFECIAG